MSFRSLLDPGYWLAAKPRIDPDSTPLAFRFQPDPDKVKLRLRWSLIGLAVAPAAAWLARDDWTYSGIALFAAGFALLNLIQAILQSRYSLSWEIASFEVVYNRRTFWGTRSWREPLSAYQGLAMRVEEFTRRTAPSAHAGEQYYVVELVHSDPARTLTLFVAKGGKPPQEALEAFSRRLRRPVLNADLSGPTPSGLLSGASEPGSPPAGVQMLEKDGTVCLAIVPSRASKLSLRLDLLLAPVFAFAAVFIVDPPRAPLFAGIVAAVMGVFYLLGSVTRRRRQIPSGLCLDARRVWIGSLGPPPHGSILLSDVGEVRLDRSVDNTTRLGSEHFHLVVESGRSRLSLEGASADRDKLEWMRAFLLHRVTRARL